MTERIDAASRVVHAPPATVFNAFATGEALMSWLPPKGMTGRTLAYDFRVGGDYAFELTSRDEKTTTGKTSQRSDVSRGRFVELVPNERFTWTVAFDSNDPAMQGEMRMTWKFLPVEGGTRVHVAATQVPSGISQEDHLQGLNATLDNLAAHVAR